MQHFPFLNLASPPLRSRQRSERHIKLLETWAQACYDKKLLAAATLLSVVLNYIEKRGPKPPKTLARSIEQLKKCDDIVITNLDKGLGVVLMDKPEFIDCYAWHLSMTRLNSGKLTSSDQAREEYHQNITTHFLKKKSISNQSFAEFFLKK